MDKAELERQLGRTALELSKKDVVLRKLTEERNTLNDEANRLIAQIEQCDGERDST